MKKLSVVVLVLLLVSMVAYGGGWTDDGTVVRLTTSSDEVGVGTTSPECKLHVEGSYEGPIYAAARAVIYANNTADGMYHNAIGVAAEVDAQYASAIYGSNGNSSGYGGYFVGKGYFSGDVGIGTTSPDYELDVNGTIRAKEIKVETGWPDFVFADDYKLMPLDKLERHIKANKSLPGIPTEKVVLEDGVNLGEMQSKFLEKIEELTLYTISQEKRLAQLEKENEELKERMAILEKQ